MRPWLSLVLLTAFFTGCTQTPDVQTLTSQGAADPGAPTVPLPAPSGLLTQPDPLAAPTTAPAPVLPEAAQ